MENLEAKRRVDFKDVEVSGRKFRIGKFDALEGSFMLFKVLNVISPLFSKMSAHNEASEVDYSAMLSGVTSLSKNDFKEIQLSCLKICSEHLAAGFAPVMNENGTFGIIGVEKDTATIINLTVQALMFNVSDFFAGSPLSFLTGASDIFQPNTKI